MQILLDTHTFLWLISDDANLSKKAKRIFLDQNNDLFLSLVSIWEIAIKISIGKLFLKKSIEQFIPEQLQENNIKQLNINFRHITKVTNLPFHHRDPVDRLLVAQALEENIPILSNDKAFDSYPIKRLW